MKTRNIFLLALSAIFAAACHTWDEPSAEAGMESYGNQYIQETNVVTIAALKTQYKSVISDNGLQQITKPTQIKVIVTGNDEGSNLYKQLYVSDGTGSLYMSIDKSGIFSEAAVGQCMLIELEGLYIGAYGKQPEIGTFYHNDSKNMDQVGRMSRYTWQDHFRLIPPVEGLSAKPEEIRSMSALDMEKDCGKLITLVGVKMKGADGKITFAPGDGSAQLVGGCVNRDIDGMSNVVVRTSTYAKYAAMIMPTEAIDITGIAARYNNTWQIMPRTQDDIQKSTHEPITPPDPAGTGTKDDPYNVAGVLAYVESLGDNVESPNDVYFSGIITSITEEFTTQYGNGTFIVSDDEFASNSFTFYRGLYLGNKKFTASDTQVKKGDKVVICGKVVKFVNNYGSTPETAQNKAYLYSLNSDGGGEGGSGDTGEAKGTGTEADPFNVAAAIAKCQEVGQTASSEIFYVKGIVNADYTVDSYKNATFDLVDAEGASQKFKAFRVKGADGKALKEGYKIPKGATVIVSGKLVNYGGNTPETAQNSGTLISVNGQAPQLDGEDSGSGATGEAKGTGTEADPFNVAAAIAKCQETGTTATTDIYFVKGIVNAEYTVDSYKNATIDLVDTEGASQKFKAFRVKGADGKGLKEGYKIPKGATVVVSGKLVNYNGNTPETAQNSGTLISVNGSAPELAE